MHFLPEITTIYQINRVCQFYYTIHPPWVICFAAKSENCFILLCKVMRCSANQELLVAILPLVFILNYV